MNIYEIKKEYLDILSNEKFIDLETGELTEEWVNAFKNNQEAKESKCENIARFIRNLENENESYKREIDRMSILNKRNSNKVLWLKNLLVYALDWQAFDTQLFKFSFRKSESTKIIDKNLLPAQFIIEEIIEKIAWLPEIKKFLKSEIEARCEDAGIVLSKDEVTEEVYTEYGIEVSFNNNLQIK